MAIVVTHKEKGGEYIVLGAGYGAYKASHPSVFFGSLAPTEKSGQHSLVLVCDGSGDVGWLNTANIRVLRVDGRSPAETLQSGS